MLKATLIIDVKTVYSVRPANLLKARNQAGLSQEELAALLNGLWGFSRQGISRIEGQGLAHAIDTDVIEQFRRAGFNIKLEQ